MYYKVLGICISRRFLEDCSYCYSQQIVSDYYNLMKRAPET